MRRALIQFSILHTREGRLREEAADGAFGHCAKRGKGLMEVYVYGKTPPFLLTYNTTVQGSEGGGGGGSKFLSAPPFYSSSLQEEGILSNVQSMYNGVSMKICLRLARSKKGGPRPRSCTGSSFYSFFALK